ncbi:MAG: hypothetical protein P8175_13055, partial [Deltaproteobacteria bacterium]
KSRGEYCAFGKDLPTAVPQGADCIHHDDEDGDLSKCSLEDATEIRQARLKLDKPFSLVYDPSTESPALTVLGFWRGNPPGAISGQRMAVPQPP